MQNHYQITVSLNGSFFFSTSEHSVLDECKAKIIYNNFIVNFPKSEGYKVRVTYWQTSGKQVNFN